MKELTIEEVRRVIWLEQRILKVQKKMAWRRAKRKAFQEICIRGLIFLLGNLACYLGIECYLGVKDSTAIWSLLIAFVIELVLATLLTLYEKWNLETANLK